MWNGDGGTEEHRLYGACFALQKKKQQRHGRSSVLVSKMRLHQIVQENQERKRKAMNETFPNHLSKNEHAKKDSRHNATFKLD